MANSIEQGRCASNRCGVRCQLPGGAGADGAGAGALEAPLLVGCSGLVNCAHDVHWLHGFARIDAGDLVDNASRRYRHVFATQQQGMPHVQRLRNCLPRINERSPGA